MTTPTPSPAEQLAALVTPRISIRYGCLILPLNAFVMKRAVRVSRNAKCRANRAKRRARKN